MKQEEDRQAGMTGFQKEQERLDILNGTQNSTTGVPKKVEEEKKKSTFFGGIGDIIKDTSKASASILGDIKETAVEASRTTKTLKDDIIETGFSGANKLLGDSKAKDECKILGGAKKLLKGTIAEGSDSESEEKGGDYEQHEKKLAKEAEIKEFQDKLLLLGGNGVNTTRKDL